MKVILVRHGETLASSDGLIQGSADGEINELTGRGISKVKNSASRIVSRIINNSNAKSVKVFSGTQSRMVDTAFHLVTNLDLEDADLARRIECFTDERINGRDYGILEGDNEAELRKPKNIILKPAKTWSYLLAEAGLANFARIERKSQYEKKVDSFVGELLFAFENSDDDLIIIVGGSDFINTLRKGKVSSKNCYFGDETLDEKGKVTRSKVKLDTAGVREIEMGRATIYDDGYVESFAEKKLKDQAENQKI